MARTRVIGLTGGIGSGKSTVAQMLAALGARVIDADQVARELVEPGQPARDAIVAAFGPEILDGEGLRIDRKRLGAAVFADPARRRVLNAILHPRIAAETARRVAAENARGTEVVVYEAALLVENGVHRALDGLIVVAAAPEKQLARVIARDTLDEAEARRRLDAQAPLADKIAVADYVIDNDGARDATARRAAEVWRDIVDGGPARSP